MEVNVNMKIELLDIDRLIEVNNIEEVTSPKLFSNKMIFDPGGILSNEIFGISKDDRRNTYAYIKLKKKFIHPHLYSKVLKSVFRNIIYIVSGQKRYTVINGKLVEDADNGWTGLESLYDHWDEIREWGNNSDNQNRHLLKKLSKDEVFIDKMIVCPPAYRDVMIAGSMDSSDHVNELNNLYTALIRSVSIISEGGLFARTQYATQAKIQDLLVSILDYFKSQISRKQGLIRRNLMGKKVDYGARSVISAPSYDNERIEDNIIDFKHSAIPISLCCSTFYPFIESWLINFFTREIINNPNLVTYYDKTTDKEYTAIIKEPEIQFSQKNIHKMISDYMMNADNRFKPIQVKVIVPTNKGTRETTASMILKGKKFLPNNVQTELNRVMTITDAIYLACVDSCEHRHMMISRYPVGTDKGIFFNRIRVQSTAKHVKVIFNGKEYPFYPDIDLSIDQSKVGVQFIDTLVMSNSHLDGMGEQECRRSFKTPLIVGKFR